MSRCLWVMLIFIISQLKIKLMALNYLENCYYEKRSNTALHGNNDLYDRWISDFDCFDRCLRTDPQKCRSFEYWHRNGQGLCIRANVSLTDYPSIVRPNAFVDYHEINCRRDYKVIMVSTVNCTSDHLIVMIQLNGNNPNGVLLGDRNCKINWANETHAQFITHINNCSLILRDDSLVGKISWKGVHKDNTSPKHYARFFFCQPNLHHVDLLHRTATKPTSIDRLLTHSNSEILNEDHHLIASSYRFNLTWTLHNHSYSCPEACLISLYSFVTITLDDLSSSSSKIFISSCDLKAIYPYTNYLRARRLIYQSCSVDPSVIHVPTNSSSSSTFHFSFYLYHILKEPIPFEILCIVLHNYDRPDYEQAIDCSSTSVNDNDHRHDQLLMNRNDKRDYSYISLRSSKVYVTRQLPTIEFEREPFHSKGSIISIATVHYTECCVFAFCVLLFNVILKSKTF